MPRIRHWQLTSVLLVALSVALGVAVAKGHWLQARDSAISANLQALDHGWVHTVMAMASAVFSPIGGATILVLLVLGLALRKRWRDALVVTVTICGGWFSSLALKAAIDRPRPEGAIQHSASYPSGHIALVTAVVFAIFFLARTADWRDTVATGGALLIVLVAFSRVIQGAHYLSDTVGAILWVSGIVVGLSGLWNLTEPRISARTEASLAGGQEPRPRERVGAAS